jgi:hypothetical protein
MTGSSGSRIQRTPALRRINTAARYKGSNPLPSSGESDANLIFEPETGEPADRNIGWHAAMPAAISPHQRGHATTKHIAAGQTGKRGMMLAPPFGF